MTEEQSAMLVVLDSDAASRAPLTIAQRYASSTVLLSSWAADPLEITAETHSSASAEPTISEALQVAAQRGISWIGLRRSFIPPQELLGELLMATAQHTTDAIPGFAVFLADGEPEPFQHILAIVNRSDGPMSGLLVHAAVAVADVSGAHLDFLVIGGAGENPHTEDEMDGLVISREQELYDAAVARALDRDVVVNWITAASVTDLWPVVSDQLAQHDYDLVIDDLGDLSLAKVGTRGTIEEALARGAVGELPRHLLTDTSLPLLLVIDEIRLRWAPERLLRAGAVAAMTLGVMVTPVAAAATVPLAVAAPAHKRDPAADLVAELESALEVASGSDADATTSAAAVEARMDSAGSSSRGAAGQGARSVAQQGSGPAQVASLGLAAAADPSDTSRDGDSPAEAPRASRTSEASRTPKAPKGGATPHQVARAQREAAKERSALEKDKRQKEKSEAALARIVEDHAEALAAATVAVADLKASAMSQTEAAAHAERTASAATGVASILAGGPTQEEVDTAVLAEQAAAQRLESALARGEQTLHALQAAEQSLGLAEGRLDGLRAEVEQTRAEYEQSRDKAEVYRASLARTRQSPVAKGNYRLTARFGNSGGYWSSGVHTGLDFAGPYGTPIMAAASGTVVSTGFAGRYGNQVIINHGHGYRTTYNHMSTISVSPGTKVSTGDGIGRIGSTGNSTGSHLHFEVTKDGEFINPETWLGW